MNGGKNIVSLIIGGLVVAAAAIFILTGGELGGKTTVNSDKDLPPIAGGAPHE